MNIGLDMATIVMGIIIFLARVTDVTIGTVRMISTVQGRTKTAFCLGFLEVSMWLVVISTVVNKIMNQPILGVFYALGFSTGNVVGILLERRLALGHMALRIVSPQAGQEMAARIRDAGYAVTTFQGQGLSGAVTMLYLVCLRKDLNRIIELVKDIDPDAFYTTEHASQVSRLYRPIMEQELALKSIVKKK